MRKIQKFLLSVSVNQNLKTDFTTIHHMSVLPSNNVVVSGTESDRCKLIRYSLQKGAALSNAALDDFPQGMVSFTVDSVHLLALSYG